MKEPKKELAGVKEIAKRANVSIATVDRVIHNRTGVSDKTKEKIQAIIKELDYQPNILARRLASRKVLNFAVLIPEVSSETAFWEAPLKGILEAQAEIERYGINVGKYFFDQNDRKSFVKQADLILKSKVDGVLMAPSFIEESIKFTTVCRERRIPYVFINSDIPNQDSLCYIGPNLFHSGYLSAHLMNYLVKKEEKILIVNISKEIDNEHHLLRKEEGFRTYFKNNGLNKDIVKTDIQKTDYLSVKKNLIKVLKSNPGIQAIFVTNSRVSSVARFLEESDLNKFLLVGYDFLEGNVEFLKKDVIDFLICQKPQEQGFRGLMALYQRLVHSQDVEKIHFMPIDIITRENYQFYNN
jgi:LacI family transcriptional regulator